MDPYSFNRFLDCLAFNSSIVSDDSVSGVGNISALFDSIESPVVNSVGSGDLLSNGGEETLRVEESSQPVGHWTLHRSLLQPGGQLVMPVVQRS